MTAGAVVQPGPVHVLRAANAKPMISCCRNQSSPAVFEEVKYPLPEATSAHAEAEREE